MVEGLPAQDEKTIHRLVYELLLGKIPMSYRNTIETITLAMRVALLILSLFDQHDCSFLTITNPIGAHAPPLRTAALVVSDIAASYCAQ